ncbi:SRPBCC family protein [Blastomonas aquatica]|uniref:Uncharacterized protein n=1 Tax=Blastomonas aquatica TaxID=1510276 RepID=A0ABQ1JMF6_9SPHN|nr:SRPBCC family protein [Blastomonas aquatica]GGB72780.1 hypothetical protein GCM10010833_29960 [Blastomonas aquatica]
MSAGWPELVRRSAYSAASFALIASQNLVAWGAIKAFSVERVLDVEFWLTPLSSAMSISSLPPIWGAVIFAYSLLVAWLLALMSFQLARRTNRGFILAVGSVVPVLQLGAILLNAVLPARKAVDEMQQSRATSAKNVTMGLIAGIALVVLAVLISAVTFGAYGYGLFVMTPFLVGITCGYLVNEQSDLGASTTMKLVIAAAGLGSLALVVLALEGIVCIILAAPLAIPIVMLGGVIGRGLAIARHNRRTPLASVAILPMVFMLEAAMPPDAPIVTQYDIEIAAPAEQVWQALISSEPIAPVPGLPALAGLAYPIKGTLKDEGLGATRMGVFSTGTAIEVVTEWEPNRLLAFRVEDEAPAMEEMSPYRRVHAPHVEGYFTTGETRFVLVPLAGNRTRLKISSEHRLRIDPVPYWEPIARLTIHENVSRVLTDIKAKSELDHT